MHLFDKEVFRRSIKDIPKVFMWSTLWGVAGVMNSYSKYGIGWWMATTFLLLTLQAGLLCIVLGALIDQVRSYIKRKKAA